jgi:hypothetical protein
MISWNTCRIIIDENQPKEAVASALHRLADMIAADAIPPGGAVVVALRAADDQLVGAATLSNMGAADVRD